MRLATLRNSSFNHSIRAQEQGLRDPEVESLRRLEVDDELEPCRLLDRDVGRPGTFEYLVHEGSRTPIEIDAVRAIRHQPACLDEPRSVIHRRKASRIHQGSDKFGWRQKVAIKRQDSLDLLRHRILERAG